MVENKEMSQRKRGTDVWAVTVGTMNYVNASAKAWSSLIPKDPDILTINYFIITN